MSTVSWTGLRIEPQLTLDDAAFGVGAPDLAGPLAAVLLAGCGHNAHVEKPAALRPLLDQLLQAFLAINVQ